MKGIIDISKLKNPPEKHELNTAKYFSDKGFDVEFIPPSNIPGVHRPDILMQGVEWEIKCPQGKGKRTIDKLIKQAVKQSHYIVVDLRRIKISTKRSLSQLETQFNLKTYIKKLLAITKEGELVEFSRK